MPSIPLIKTEKLIRILKKYGFTVDESKGKGSHAKLYGFDGSSTTIPRNLDSPSVRSSIGRFLTAQGKDLDEMFG